MAKTDIDLEMNPIRQTMEESNVMFMVTSTYIKKGNSEGDKNTNTTSVF